MWYYRRGYHLGCLFWTVVFLLGLIGLAVGLYVLSIWAFLALAIAVVRLVRWGIDYYRMRHP